MKPDKQAQRKKRQAIILGVLMLLLSVMAVRHFMPQPRKSSAAVTIPGATTDATASVARQQKLTPVQLTWPLIARADPFAPHGVYPPKSEPKPATSTKVDPPPMPVPAITVEQVREQARKTLKLQGMILGAVPRAVINGQPVAAGDEVDGFVIVRIENRRITVRKSGLEFELELK